jgi:pimeloyl-ACP methyl ester carboxylesterase
MTFRLTPHTGQQVLDRGQRRARWQRPVVDQPKDRQASTLAGTSRPFCVHTGDGARIAVGALGDGPGLVMVHGSIADHTTFDSSISALAHDLTIFAMGRRGFGASPDGQQTQSGGHSGSTGVIQLAGGRREWTNGAGPTFA